MDPPPNPPEDSTMGENTVSGEKRAPENESLNELETKKARKSEEGGGIEAAKRVAEIVLVLSSMWRMRGGDKAPTEAEAELMVEAREKLVEMCVKLSPKDIVSRDRVEKLIEDLGLNGRAKEQRLGFRGQRLSIKEKLELNKRKMEDSKKFASQPTLYASHGLQGIPHSVRMFPPDKTGPTPGISSGGFPAASPPGHVSSATATLPHQLPNNDVRGTTASTGLAGSHLVRDSLGLPRPIKLDGVNASHAQVNASTNHQLVNSSSHHPLVNAPTWSVQTRAASSATLGQNPVKAEGTAAMVRAPSQGTPQNFRPFGTQPTTGNLPVMQHASQGTTLAQAPRVGSSHNEIARVVQMVLHPKLPEHPTWTPPSREYMNKALTCQICKLTVNEVETIALCDACEKGFHLKCLQLNNQKPIPRSGEWHCVSCLKLSGGKPLPPKYGRVMRSVNTPKMPSNTLLQSPEKKVGAMDSNISQKVMENGISADVTSNSTELASDAKIQTAQGQETSSGTQQNNSTTGAVPDNPSVDSSSEKVAQPNQVTDSSEPEIKPVSEPKPQPPVNPETAGDNSDSFQPSSSQPSQTTPTINSDPANSVEDSVKDSQNNSIVKQDEKNDTQPDAVATFELPDNLHSVEWRGDVIQTVDGKNYYQSCCISGETYKLQDHALFQSGPDRLIPSKLQAMWEDTGTGSKWVMVNRCFFPNDLPEAVGCPCAPETSEVYESNNESTLMAGLIRGGCEVLPSVKFREETERRSQPGVQANEEHPIFLCKWFFDEVKGVFRPVSG